MPTDDDGRIRIRRALVADADTLTALTHASRAYDGPYRAILDGYAITPAQVERDEMHVAVDGGDRILGYYSLTVDVMAGAELDLLFVDDAAQGCGLGGMLFAHMLDRARARGVARVRIVSHPPSESFYLRMGAERVGEQPPRGRVTWSRPVLAVRSAPSAG